MALLTPAEMHEFVETDLTDTALASYIAGAENKIVSRFGPHPDLATTSAVQTMYGLRKRLMPWRDEGEIAVVLEDGIELTPETDYTVQNRELIRLPEDKYWGKKVEVRFSAFDDLEQRKIAAVQLVKLEMEYNGLRIVRSGDYSQEGLSYDEEIEMILSSLAGQSIGIA